MGKHDRVRGENDRDADLDDQLPRTHTHYFIEAAKDYASGMCGGRRYIDGLSAHDTKR